MNRVIEIKNNPSRIISIVPSQTELLCYLGLADKIIGRTKFCIHPSSIVKNIPVIGGTKNLRLEEIVKLKPDIVIGNLEENDRESIEKLEKEVPVWMSDIRSINAALDMISKIAIITGTEEKAVSLVTAILRELESIKTTTSKLPQRTCLYLIWKDPYMGVGTDTYIDDVLEVSGFKNILNQSARYPVLNLKEIEELSPDIIFLSSEPYPFKQKDVQELEENLPGPKIRLVDGEMFSWYGNRMLKAIPYLNDLIVNL